MGKAARLGPHKAALTYAPPTNQDTKGPSSPSPNARPKVVYMDRPPETKQKGTRGGSGKGSEGRVKAMSSVDPSGRDSG